MRRFAVTIAAFLVLVPLFAQQPSNSDAALRHIQPEIIRAHMRFLADDLLEGRGTGTRGFQLAANYVAAQFDALGLTAPFQNGGSYFQTVPLTQAIPRPRETTLRLVQGGAERQFQFGDDFLAFGSTTRDKVTLKGEVVFVGYGITAPEHQHDDYAGIDVAAKLVAVLGEAPSSFPIDARRYYGTLEVKQRNALQHGAKGILFVTLTDNPSVAGLRFAKRGKFDFPRPAPPLEAVAFLNPTTSEVLFRGTSKSLADMVRLNQLESFVLPTQASLSIKCERVAVPSPNVAGLIRGSSRPDEYLIYTAHLDHEGIDEPINGDGIYNGAVDNASGVAAILAIAQAFASHPQRPARSILFLATTGEEPGLLGTDYFTTHPPMPIDRIVASLNVDGASLMLFPLRDVQAMGAMNSTLGTVAHDAGAKLGIKVTSTSVFPGGSDHYPFVRQGIPALWIIAGNETGDPNLDGRKLTTEWMTTRLHTPKDDMSQPLDFGAAATHAKLNFLIGLQVAEAVTRPQWNPRDFFGEMFGRR